jgi:crotonobetainyl-CoA:carnitine CoA-transferase CaiB-like acyl-CoA transferase
VTAGLLDGVRVLDFTWVISGPQCSQILADFGAEVIKVEWSHHLDGLRYRVQPPGSDPASIEHSGLWNNLNRNKRSITLNMRHPDGVDLALRLVAHCDVVLENFSPGVLESWGLSWEAMTARRPGLIHVSMSGFGWDGPNARYVVFAPVMQALSGLHAMTSRPAGEPTGLGFSYGDHVGGYYAALATLAALHERDASGEGAIIDLAQVEGTITLTSAAILDYQLSGRPFVAWGNVPFGSLDAPAGLYRCDGDDAWCAISVRTDEEWCDLTATMGAPELARDGRFSDRAGRAAHRGLLDHAVTAWTQGMPRDDVMRRLQEAGVPCTTLSTAVELLDDDRLRNHGYYEAEDHPELGRREFQMGGIRSEIGPRVRRAAPLIGEANEDVYGRLLGLSAEQIRTLADEAVI